MAVSPESMIAHACLPEDLLLDARHALERQLQGEVAARHHHGVRHGEDLTETIDRFRPSEFRDDPRVGAALIGKDWPCPCDVRGGRDEAERYQVHAEGQAEREIARVFSVMPA